MVVKNDQGKTWLYIIIAVLAFSSTGLGAGVGIFGNANSGLRETAKGLERSYSVFKKLNTANELANGRLERSNSELKQGIIDRDLRIGELETTNNRLTGIINKAGLDGRTAEIGLVRIEEELTAADRRIKEYENAYRRIGKEKKANGSRLEHWNPCSFSGWSGDWLWSWKAFEQYGNKNNQSGK